MGKPFVPAGQAFEFQSAVFHGFNWNRDSETIQKLIEDPNLRLEFGRWVDNGCRLMVGSLTIDRDAAPILPEGWEPLPEDKQIQSRARGAFTWDPSKVKGVLVPGQDGGLNGTKIQSFLEGQAVERARTLQELYANQHLIPESWKDDKARVAWGDIVSGRGGSALVLYLDWGGGAWYLYWYCVDDLFFSDSPALVSAS